MTETPNMDHIASVVAWLRGQEWVGEKPTRGQSADAIEQLCAAVQQSEPVREAQLADAVVTRLYRRFKEWSERGFGPEDVTWCEVKADIQAMIAEQALALRGEPVVGSNAGHGHVWPRPDGVKARCGGPGLCAQCSRDKALYAAPISGEREQSGIDGPDFLRISKSGYSLKLGWREDKRIVACAPPSDATLEQWLKDAARLCDGWNGVSGERVREAQTFEEFWSSDGVDLYLSVPLDPILQRELCELAFNAGRGQ